MTEAPVRVGVDIGGTFTDVVLEAGGRRQSTKVLTTYERPEDAILEGIERVCQAAGVAPAAVGMIIHGTTLATNALIERRGAKTAFVTTKGFRDVIEMRTESRFEQYDLNLLNPPPLISRDHRYVLAERIDAAGRVLEALNEAQVERLADHLAEAGYESVAVGFLHSYANGDHERRVGDILTKRLPGVALSLSADVSPQMREYERFNTVCANAYVKPLMKSYLGRLAERLGGIGVSCPIFLMHSGGGIISLDSAADFPVRLVESGPAGGAIFAAHIARRHGLKKVLSFDMGGTTAKICLIRDGVPKTARVFEVARTYRFKKGSGMPISIPVIDMVEIGAGGGSLAHVDGMNQIRVGPESAGSEPGPAAYGRGGERPAVTDADLVLGRLDPEAFAGGTIKLSVEAAETALTDRVGTRLDLSVRDAAFGVCEVVDETMANAARVHAVENGEDLADYTMIAFGGAAPLHAARLCEKLGIDRLLVPPGAGVGSAIGFLRAPFSFEAARSLYTRLSDFDPGSIQDLLADLEREAVAFVRTCDADAPIETEIKAFMRYVGQGWEIPVEIDGSLRAQLDSNVLKQAFETLYTALFARTVAGLDIEITGWSVVASTPVPASEAVSAPVETGAPPVSGERTLFDPTRGISLSASVLERADFADGQQLFGPAIVTEDETSVIVPTGFRVRMRADGCIEALRDDRETPTQSLAS
ncbi:MAG: hydantoinase/oxoprolinase family protein [Pseudomonadota bacterium]